MPTALPQPLRNTRVLSLALNLPGPAALWRCGAETMENRRPATAWEENVKRMGRRMGT